MALQDATMKTILFVLSLAVSVYADNEFPRDPYLQYRPPFARSLPVQIMFTGIVLTLVAVLFIHLLFTAQYHWPLAPVNYVLQLSGVTTLLISLIATIHVVLSATFIESKKWPYMLSYIAVNIPPLDTQSDVDGWSIAERATWLVMNASTSGLIQITHIQFLTLLYPSRLEARLIFFLLGPLAVVAAVMQLLPINESVAVSDISSAVRNVCNATLSLLFTLALFIWGFLVNRKQAWRTDGGTAVFGCAALTLALVSTSLNFLYVHKEQEYVWLPGLMWAVVLWQSFLGWWWWVGAGSGGYATETEKMEEKALRKARRESRKREAREKRRETKMRAQKVWKEVAGAFVPGRSQPQTHAASTQSRDMSLSNMRSRVVKRHLQDPSEPLSSTILNRIRSSSASPTRTVHATNLPINSLTTDTASILSNTATLTHTATLTSASHNTLPRILPGFIHRWYASLRREHAIAAREQAEERVERIREINRDADGGSEGTWGWGWNGFGWRPRRGGRERKASRGRRKANWRNESEGGKQGMYEMDSYSGEEGTHGRVRRRQGDEDVLSPGEESGGDMYLSEAEMDRRRTDHDHELEQEMEEPKPTPHRTQTQNTNTNPPLPSPPPAATRPRTVWWWGPLWRWRLQDSTVY